MKLAHTMIRVRNLEKSLEFYCDFLGLQEGRRKVLGDEATLVFLADENENYFIELTFNHDGRDYDLGSQFGHLAFVVPDLGPILETIEANGWWHRRSKPEANTPYLFVHDPDGYDIEILEESK